MTKGILPISEDDTHDSYVYHAPELKSAAIKMYWNRTKEELRRYAELQNTLSWSMYRIDISWVGETFQWSIVNELIISVLNLPGYSVEGSYVWEEEKYRRPIRITEPEFVSGESLFDLYQSSSEQDRVIIKKIRHMVGNVLTYVSEKKGIIIGDKTLAEGNMKIQSFENGTVNIVVTDIARDIKDFITLNT